MASPFCSVFSMEGPLTTMMRATKVNTRMSTASTVTRVRTFWYISRPGL